MYWYCILWLRDYEHITPHQGAINFMTMHLLFQWGHFFPIGIPRDLNLTATRSSIEANWNPALIDELAIANITYKLTCSSNYDLMKDVGTSTTATMVNLTSFTNYSCCVRANSVQSQSQACGTIQTLEDGKHWATCTPWFLFEQKYFISLFHSAPSDPPRYIHIAPFGSSSVTIHWYPPLQPNGMIIGSNIYVNYSNGTNHSIKLTGGNYRSYLLGNMQPAQEVGVQISSFTNGGEGPRSILYEGRTSKLIKAE